MSDYLDQFLAESDLEETKKERPDWQRGVEVGQKGEQDQNE